MAKHFGTKNSNPSRIRFVMVEAELAEGDVGQLTQAIQNALRTPSIPTARRLATTSAPREAPVEQETESDVEDVEDKESVETSPASRARPSYRKPPPTPDVVPIDMNADVSLATFAHGKDAKSQHKKYLISAAWLKECRGVDAVTADHIYTCFRSMSWPTNILDFWQPLRDLKAKKYFGKNDKGEYEINHIGLDYVKKLGVADATV